MLTPIANPDTSRYPLDPGYFPLDAPTMSLTYPQVKTISVALSTVVGVLGMDEFAALRNSFRDLLVVMDLTSSVSSEVAVSAELLEMLQRVSDAFSTYITTAGVPPLVFTPTYTGILTTLQNHTGTTPPTAADTLSDFVEKCPSARHLSHYLANVVSALVAAHSTH